MAVDAKTLIAFYLYKQSFNKFVVALKAFFGIYNRFYMIYLDVLIAYYFTA
jgi:hypothetical protein